VSSPTREQGPGEWNEPGRAAEPCDRARPGRALPLRRPAAARRQRVQREACLPCSARSQPHPARRAVCQRQPTWWAQARGLAVPHLRGEARPRADGRAWPDGGAQPPAPSQAPGPPRGIDGRGTQPPRAAVRPDGAPRLRGPRRGRLAAGETPANVALGASPGAFPTCA
jgi:hypothetical protein